MTPSEKKFCAQVCRTAQALGIQGRRYTHLIATGFEFILPSGETVRGAAFVGMNDDKALHDACKKLSEHLV